MRVVFLCIALLLSTMAQARENPFKPVIDSTILPIASNQVEKKPLFRSAKVFLPNDARVLTSIAIYYQSIDGSIKKRVVPIDRSIDWHKPLLITQSPQSSASSNLGIEKKLIEKRAKKRVFKAKAEIKRVYRPLPFLTLSVKEKSIEMVTKDKKIRSFHLSRPFKVAIDFKRDAGFLTKHIVLSGAPFKAIDIGNHNGYYRVVVTLDAPYRYKIIENEDGYTLSLP